MDSTESPTRPKSAYPDHGPNWADEWNQTRSVTSQNGHVCDHFVVIGK